MKSFINFLAEEGRQIYKAVVHTTDSEGNEHSTSVESADNIRQKVHNTVKEMTGKGHKLKKVDYIH